MKNFSQYVNEAKVAKHRPEPESFEPEHIARLVELGILDLHEMINSWVWNPDLIMYYINSLFNRRGCKIKRSSTEITIEFKPFDSSDNFAIYHLQEDGGAVYGWVENRYYGEDDAMDPYGGDEEPNSLCNKIKAFIEWPEEYTKKFN